MLLAFYIDIWKKGGKHMRTLLEEHGGALITAALIIIFIAAIVAIGNAEFIKDLFESLIETFGTKAQSAAGFGTP